MKKSKLQLLDFLAAIKWNCLLRKQLKHVPHAEKEEETLFTAKHATQILRQYIQDWTLTAPLLDKLLELPDGENLVIQYDRTWKRKADLDKVFAHPQAVKIIAGYTRYSALPAEYEMKMLALPENTELVINYIRKFRELSPEAQLKMLDYPQFCTPEVISRCAEARMFNADTELKMLALPNAEELVPVYIKHCSFDTAAERHFLETPRWKKFFMPYIESFAVTDENDDIVLNHPDGEKLFKNICASYNICTPTQLTILDHPQAATYLAILLENHNLSEQVQEKLFEPAYRETLLPMYISTFKKELAPSLHHKLFQMPNAAELIDIYTRYHPLADTAELMLFKLDDDYIMLKRYINRHPLSETALLKIMQLNRWYAEPLMRRYASKYELPPRIMQILTTRAAFA